MSVDRQSIDVRLRRAQEMFDELGAKVADYSDRRPYGIVHEQNGDSTEHSLHLEFGEPPDTVGWGTLFGEGAQSLRNALDNAVYAVAVHETGLRHPPGAHVLAFPITEPGKKLNTRSIASLSPAVQAYVRSQQLGRDTPSTDALLVLNRIVQADKHRLVTPTVSHVSTAEIRLHNLPSNAECTPTWHRGGLVGGKPFFTLLTSEPAWHLQIDLDVEFFVVVERSWPVANPPDIEPPGAGHLADGLMLEVGRVIDGLIETAK